MGTTVSTLFFGKLPSRGDFVRSMHQPALTQMLDHWVSGTLEHLSADANWKSLYDNAPPLHFAVLGAKSRHVVAGHLLPSVDGSGRRFPFLVGGHFEVDEPLRFMARSPMALVRLWARAESSARRAHAASDAGGVMAELNLSEQQVSSEPKAYDAAYDDFLELQTVGSVQAMLRRAHLQLDIRRLLLGLGTLLQPVPASGSSRLEKGLRLPLPADPLYQPFVATWWLDLVSRFLVNGDFEMLLLLPQGPGAGAPVISLGFAGETTLALAGALDPREREAAFVDLFDPAWAEASAEQDYATRKLSSYLLQPDLSLRQATQTFREAFLGE